MTKFLFKITTIITFSTITIFASAYSDTSIINSYQSGTNEVYQAQYNSSGAILINQSLQRIYLGKDCDAYSPISGNLNWNKAALPLVAAGAGASVFAGAGAAASSSS